MFPILLIASIGDLSQFRVPNTVILCGLILGLLTQCFTKGWTGIVYWMVGSSIPVSLCFVLYLFRMFGAADVKLFSMIGSIYGVSFVIRVMFVSFFIGGIFSAYQMIHYKNAKERFGYFLNYVKRVQICKKILPYYDVKSKKNEEVIPFAICISLSVLFCVLQK